ncbi:zf-DHHC-domain-containing protein [Hesseltinella vesiculosa]|uniref:Palmitoyltransferase n=1 Tax=Hesseltinella vesiculosa TaxID=101127 RepID=A0A1X2GSY0_9FUNG|nr:zf-DHHC-domain-containing protein [Hesseltinella vesiculosa]
MSSLTSDTTTGLLQHQDHQHKPLHYPDMDDDSTDALGSNETIVMQPLAPSADKKATDAASIRDHDPTVAPNAVQQRTSLIEALREIGPDDTPPAPSSHAGQGSQSSVARAELIEIHHELLASSTDRLDATLARGVKPSQPTKRQRNYQVFPGNSIFFCQGRLMTSRSYWAFCIALVLLIAPCVLFAIFTCPFLWTQVSPAIPIIFAYLFLLSLVNMIKASWTDPGVIPRGLDPTPTLENFDDHSSIWTQPFPADRCVKIKDEMWNLKYCDTCKIYRPPRASHCRQCDNCVENEDHHCIWLNNCIGKRNYRTFFTFLTASSLLAVYTIVFCLLHFLLAAYQIQSDISFDLAFQQAPVSFVLAIVGFVLLWMVGGLTSYHCHLVWKGFTTHEKLRASYINPYRPGNPNPYGQKSPSLNIMRVLCRPQPKSHLQRRKFVD